MPPEEYYDKELHKPNTLANPLGAITRGREKAYNKGHDDGQVGLYHACPYIEGSSYRMAYMDGFHDGRHGDD